MSENELDEILNDIKRRANANLAVEPPVVRSSNDAGSSRSSASASNLSGSSAVSQRKNDANNFDLLSFSDNHRVSRDDYESRDHQNKPAKPPKKNNKKGIIIAIIAVVLVVAVAIGCYFIFGKEKDNTDTKEAKPKTTAGAVVDTVLNPLTGESGYNKNAIDTRPVAVVVENEYSTEAVRPQWALSDADIVLEGESEFSTRLLLFWADYTDVPEMVGPTRSARPPFIRFSQLFDSVFIHAGLSSSKGNYIGANTVFETENVDHINLLSCTEDGEYFGRNNDRYTAVEHTGYLNGTNLPKLIEEKNISMKLDSSKFSSLNFNKEAKAIGDTKAEYCEFVWSTTGLSACPKTGKFTYDADKHKYTTTDFDSSYGESNAAFENLILLLDETEYIVKENYKNSGSSEIYCDYKLSGGKGTVLSEGTAAEITWGVTDGKLWMKTSDGQDLALNPGKSYIGYGSSNHGGSIKLNQASSDDDVNNQY
ncbi:MAG: DUF3048 domain-containing protein [Clostridium sp.]|nr:DUF3048 domain-containing protein [Clostridium sp.]